MKAWLRPICFGQHQSSCSSNVARCCRGAAQPRRSNERLPSTSKSTLQRFGLLIIVVRDSGFVRDGAAAAAAAAAAKAAPFAFCVSWEGKDRGKRCARWPGAGRRAARGPVRPTWLRVTRAHVRRRRCSPKCAGANFVVLRRSADTFCGVVLACCCVVHVRLRRMCTVMLRCQPCFRWILGCLQSM